MGVNMFNFSFEHSLGEMRKLAGPDIVLVGNIPPRDVLAGGTPEQVKTAVNEAFDETDNYDRIIWSAGGGMPQDVSTANIQAFIDAVREREKRL
jgi:uroporphyrinogen decarboxylase